MASLKPLNILKSKTDIDIETIKAMSDEEAWVIIYGLKGEPKTKPISICFTGFRESEKANLQLLAEQSGLSPRTSVNSSTDYLRAGPEAGPSKLMKAKEFGVVILNMDDFMNIVETGELPGN